MYKAIFHLIGDAGVGKTSIVYRYVQNKFSLNYNSTVGVDYLRKNISINGREFQLRIYDTAGQERFDSITKAQLHNSNGVIIVFDLSKRDSFANLEKWINLVNETNIPNIQMVLVGNKSDLDHVVQNEEANVFAYDHGNIGYFETSAKDNTNIAEVFNHITSISEEYLKPLDQDGDIHVQDKNKQEVKEQDGKNCC